MMAQSHQTEGATNVRWFITKTDHPGGAWLVREQSPEAERILAFRTLDASREYVASVVRINQRVRFTKMSETQYTYER